MLSGIMAVLMASYFSTTPPPPGGLWDWRGRGDVRAVLNVSAATLRASAGGPLVGAGCQVLVKGRKYVLG